MGHQLMLVSARADTRLRDDVRCGRRPCPEYLRLEERHGVELLDWSRLGARAATRSPRLSLRHAVAGLRRLKGVDVVFSDGEHVGVPLAVAMRVCGLDTPHLVLGHHVTTRVKQHVFHVLKPQPKISRLLVHSSLQLEVAAQSLDFPRRKLAFVPYGVDADFWAPGPRCEEPLVVSVGRDHRDYTTLAQACSGLPAQVYIAAGSTFSPGARQDQPASWPDNFKVGFAGPVSLLDWYTRASVVVVPLVPNDFQAGVTVILEAMAMAKAVIVTATAGQRDVIEEGATGMLVPPRDPLALQDAVRLLLENSRERQRLGANAREAAVTQFSLDRYADELAGHMSDICRESPAPISS